jgi:hypothetical protein
LEVTFLTGKNRGKRERSGQVWKFCSTGCGIEEDGATESDVLVLWCRSGLGTPAACYGHDDEFADSIKVTEHLDR